MISHRSAGGGTRGAGSTTCGTQRDTSVTAAMGSPPVREDASLPGGKGVVESIYELMWSKNNLLQVSVMADSEEELKKFSSLVDKPQSASECER